MVKMETTEPSVILKLKKGGHVAVDKDDNGHTNMKGAGYKAKYDNEACEEGSAPKKPSMSDRRKAMSGALLNSKKGGKVEKKAMGGMMGTPAMAAPADPRKMAMMKALMARKAAMGGGSPPSMSAPAMPLANAKPMTPGSAMKKGGKAGDKSQDKAMITKAFKEHDAQEHKGGKGTKLKLATGGLTNPMKTGGKVSGAAIDAAMDKTTVKGNAGAFAKTKMERKATNPGYERYAAGGTVEGNAGKFANTKMERKATNPGYERYATGGVVNGMATGGLTNPMKKGGKVDFANRPANTSKADPGYERYATGGLTNPMKKGGAAKKHFATGGSVSTGRAVAMPKHLVSQPISNSRQSGTFKKGGAVMNKAKGGLTDASKGAYDAALLPDSDQMDTAHAIRRMLGLESVPSAGAGRGFVNPPMAKKRGGSAKC